ncbi:MAG: Cys-Gln thioester bond-forming surface protein [Oscillospiraceae bacterium]|nr:Cys-Gln thioester bond-forming surface protein [Oscillospiraceae bacterium]
MSGNPHRTAGQRHLPAAANQYPDAIYCLRGGIGFGSPNTGSGTAIQYRRYGDMFTNRVAVRNRFNQVINASGNSATYRGTITEGNYNAILWLIEQMYLPRFAAATSHPNHAIRYAGRQEMRLQLLTNVRESTASNPLVTVANLNAWLSDDDIEVVQQIVLWQFANADRPGNTSVVLRSGATIDNTLHIGAGSGTISGSHPNTGLAMRMLYDYLMAGASRSSKWVNSIYASEANSNSANSNFRKHITNNATCNVRTTTTMVSRTI